MRVICIHQGADGPDGGATPIILIILDDEHAHQMRTAGEEVKARGADITVITDNPKLAEVSSIPSQLRTLVSSMPEVFVSVSIAVHTRLAPAMGRCLALTCAALLPSFIALYTHRAWTLTLLSSPQMAN